ncbi:IclR family transcriptional regulator [Rhodococcus sp. NPDC058514]|uniref:IclR family transcriptional regulator n=1 Tax=unclassified Rhodococcus (in: high G+C Gram-positive bacteria) TaxID=192944 RepID=UPI003648C2B8
MDDHTVSGRLLAIIDAIAELDGRASLAALAATTGIPKPTVMRVANDLASRGVLRRDPRGYRLGARLIDPGAIAAMHHGKRDAAMPHLQELFARTGEVIALALVRGDDLAELERVYGDNREGIAQRSLISGPVTGAASTAMGRCLLSHRPDLADVVLHAPIPQLTPYTVTNPRELRDDLSAALDDGFAVEYEQTLPGLCCVSAPIVDGNGDVVGGVGIVGRPSVRFTPDRLTRSVLSAATDIAADWSKASSGASGG